MGPAGGKKLLFVHGWPDDEALFAAQVWLSAGFCSKHDLSSPDGLHGSTPLGRVLPPRRSAPSRARATAAAASRCLAATTPQPDSRTPDASRDFAPWSLPTRKQFANAVHALPHPFIRALPCSKFAAQVRLVGPQLRRRRCVLGAHHPGRRAGDARDARLGSGAPGFFGRTGFRTYQRKQGSESLLTMLAQNFWGYISNFPPM